MDINNNQNYDQNQQQGQYNDPNAPGQQGQYYDQNQQQSQQQYYDPNAQSQQQYYDPNAAQYTGQTYGNQSYGQPAQPPAPGHGLAVGALVCGIIGVVCWFLGYGAFLSIVAGIIGLVLAAKAKAQGNTEGIRTAGFVLSLIATIVGALVFVACLACGGTIFAAILGELDNLDYYY